jgi:hypothetical protein
MTLPLAMNVLDVGDPAAERTRRSPPSARCATNVDRAEGTLRISAREIERRDQAAVRSPALTLVDDRLVDASDSRGFRIAVAVVGIEQREIPSGAEQSVRTAPAFVIRHARQPVQPARLLLAPSCGGNSPSATCLA